MNGPLHDELAAARLQFLNEAAQKNRRIPMRARTTMRVRIGTAIVHLGEKIEGCRDASVRATPSLR